MRRSFLGLMTALLTTLAGCGGGDDGDPAGTGYVVTFQLERIDVARVDELRLTLRPAASDAPFGEADTSYAGGGVRVSSSGGTLVTRVTGDYVRAHATTPQFGPTEFDLELRSTDDMPRGALQIVAVAVRATEQIGTGAGVLSSWPPAPGGTSIIRIPCAPGADASCRE